MRLALALLLVSSPALAKPTHGICKPPLSTVAGRYIVTPRASADVEAVARDVAAKYGVVLRRVWSFTHNFSVDATPAQLKKLLADERLQDVQDDCVG
jgi:hypothetical protein